MKELKISSDEFKKQMDDLEIQRAYLKDKMRVQMKADDLEEHLADMKYRQANGHMSLYDEKQLVK